MFSKNNNFKNDILNLKNNQAYLELSKLHDDGINYFDALKIALLDENWKEKYKLQAGDLNTLRKLIYNTSDMEDIKNQIRYGLGGEIVEKLAPHTEADPIAILVQFLTAFGNVVGRMSFVKVGATTHSLNLFALIVGTSSKSRKGTSWDFIQYLFNNNKTTSSWLRDNIKSGLTSGEGMAYHTRDALSGDPGVLDKRLLIVESEFASVLKVIRREGNTLSSTIRDAWDGKPLRNLSKNSPTTSTDPHISIIGHITEEEFKKNLNEVEIANGFANRFLILQAKRARYLSSGGNLENVNLTKEINALHKAISFAQNQNILKRSPECEKIWDEEYFHLSRERTGMLGAVLSRAEAQVLRLSCIYALLDCSNIIKIKHLKPALSLWSYVEHSCKEIFQDNTGNAHINKILKALQDSPNGLTRTEIVHKVFNKNLRKHQIDSFRTMLVLENKMIVIDRNGVELWKSL